jgi:lipoprotein-anchoring transpeptidase ErfK/SrfK
VQHKSNLVLEGKKALRYPVGVGREGKEWSGTNRISNKRQWPDWRPPPQMIQRELERGIVIPNFVKGGAKSPLGARALYIGQTEFRIHGTTQPNSIGRAVSSGCIRMHNAHVIDLYNRVKIGATVVVE